VIDGEILGIKSDLVSESTLGLNKEGRVLYVEQSLSSE
jgi:hypothetical protein